MGWLRIFSAKDAKGDPLPLPDWAVRMNAEADRVEHSLNPMSDEAAMIELMQTDERGFNK